MAEDAQLLELLAMLTVESSVLHACSDCVGNLGGIVNVKKGVCNAKTDVKSMWERSNSGAGPRSWKSRRMRLSDGRRLSLKTSQLEVWPVFWFLRTP